MWCKNKQEEQAEENESDTNNVMWLNQLFSLLNIEKDGLVVNGLYDSTLTD